MILEGDSWKELFLIIIFSFWLNLMVECFWTAMLEKILESPLDSKESHTVHHKGNQSWIFTGGTDAETETPILWLPDVKNWLIWKDPDAGTDWRGEGDNRGWNGWMASLTWWAWVWVSSRSWSWTEKPGVLQSMGWQRVGHDWVTELNWTEWLKAKPSICKAIQSAKPRMLQIFMNKCLK